MECHGREIAKDLVVAVQDPNAHTEEGYKRPFMTRSLTETLGVVKGLVAFLDQRVAMVRAADAIGGQAPLSGVE